MAEEKQNEQADTGKKGKLKTIIIMVVTLLIAVAGAVGATLYFLGGEGDSETGAGEQTEPADAEKTLPPAVYFSFRKPLIVTLSADGRQRHMQVGVSLVARNEAELEKIQQHEPLLRSRLRTLANGQDFRAMLTDEGKQRLQQAMLEKVNAELEQLGLEPVEKVLFTSFVLQ